MSSSFIGGLLGRVLQALVLVLLSAAGLAAAPPEVPLAWPGQDGSALSWEDRSGNASLQQAQEAFEANLGIPADFKRLVPLGGERAVWYRLQLPSVLSPVRAIFTLNYPGMDRVDLFRPDAAGGWTVQQSGDLLPVKDWPLRYLQPAFVFTMQPGRGEIHYLRVQNSTPVAIDWTLRGEHAFDEAAEALHLRLGAYVGFMALVVLLSIANTFSWRDPIHLYFAVHVVLVTLAVMAHSGLGGEFVWPGNAWWNDIARPTLPALGMAWAAVFLRELIAERGMRWLSWLLLVHAIISALIALSFVVIGRTELFALSNYYAIAATILVLGVLVWYSWRRPQVGLWVLAGLAALAAGSLLPMLRNVGWLPLSAVMPYLSQIGGVLGVPLVLIGLYFRSRERRDNRARLQGLSHTDPLTGVANHRVLLERVQEMLRAARRDGASAGAILRVRVANLEALREQYGREASEAALVRAAECVGLEAGEHDLVAREQGSDLVLVLEGPVTRANAAEAARNIIARGLKFSNRLPPHATLSIRVAGVCAPLPNGNARGMLALLGRALADMASSPKRRAVRIMDAGGGSSGDISVLSVTGY